MGEGHQVLVGSSVGAELRAPPRSRRGGEQHKRIQALGPVSDKHLVERSRASRLGGSVSREFVHRHLRERTKRAVAGGVHHSSNRRTGGLDLGDHRGDRLDVRDVAGDPYHRNPEVGEGRRQVPGSLKARQHQTLGAVGREPAAHAGPHRAGASRHDDRATRDPPFGRGHGGQSNQASDIDAARPNRHLVFHVGRGDHTEERIHRLGPQPCRHIHQAAVAPRRLQAQGASEPPHHRCFRVVNPGLGPHRYRALSEHP